MKIQVLVEMDVRDGTMREEFECFAKELSVFLDQWAELLNYEGDTCRENRDPSSGQRDSKG